MSETGPSDIPQVDRTRRNLLKAIGGAVVSIPGILSGREALLNRGKPAALPTPQEPVSVTSDVVDSEKKNLPSTPVADEKQSAQPAEQQNPMSVERNTELTAVLSRIAAVPLFTPERTVAEAAYIKPDMRLDEIDKGLWIITNKNIRKQLIDKRYTLRKNLHGLSGNERSTYMEKHAMKEASMKNTLTHEEEIWCDSNGIHPEILAGCKDAYEEAIPVITKLQEKRGDEFRKRITVNGVEHVEVPTDLLVSPYAMAMLFKQETSSFQGIGGTRAYDALTRTSEKDALEKYTNEFHDKTGVVLNSRNVPGSRQGAGDSSGGALGAQFMPSNCHVMDELLKEADETDFFNVFDLISSMKGAYVFLARHQDHGLGRDNEGSELIRYGYSVDETPTHIKYSIMKWNPSNAEATAIVNAMVPKAIVTPFPSAKYPRQLAA